MCMITGDNLQTGIEIGRKCGLVNPANSLFVLETKGNTITLKRDNITGQREESKDKKEKSTDRKEKSTEEMSSV